MGSDTYKLMEVDPVLPTYAKTVSRELTVMAVMYVPTITNVEINANRVSDISGTRVLAGGAWASTRLGRHLRTLSILARQGCTCSGYEKTTRMTIAAQPMVVAHDGVYCAMMFPMMLSPNEM